MKFLHNTNRVEAFSDAVFAFAATLLVVSLNDENSTTILKINLIGFVGFAVSFFILVSFWKLHYNFFRRTSYIDNWIITFNSVLLFVVLYYVFPLKSLINSWFGKITITADSLASLFELYGLGFLLIFLCFSLMYRRAYKKNKNMDSAMLLLFYHRHFAIFVIVALISIVLAISRVGLYFGLPGFIYALLGPLCFIHSKQFYKKYGPLKT